MDLKLHMIVLNVQYYSYYDTVWMREIYQCAQFKLFTNGRDVKVVLYKVLIHLRVHNEEDLLHSTQALLFDTEVLRNGSEWQCVTHVSGTQAWSNDYNI